MMGCEKWIGGLGSKGEEEEEEGGEWVGGVWNSLPS